MRVSLSWLKEYVDADIAPEKLAEEFDMTGTGVESIEYYGREYDKIVVGQIKKSDKHPNADKLSICSVDIGKKELLNIVCGAPNSKEGSKVPVALVGAELPGGFKIQNAKIRGIASEGMMCSEAELGLGEDTSGLMILENNAPVGRKISEFLDLEDVVFELEITPNRPDCLGMLGMAREVAAITGGKSRKPKIRLVEDKEEAKDVTKVEILDPDLCPRYVAKVIKDVKILPSPAWMQRKLEKAGVRPINNVVDITNYVMMETGQPLHAFDYDKLTENRIVVRRAKAGETMVSLDEITRQLDDSMLVIADAKEPVALAGVMGGLYSEVSARTVNILLESAHFNPSNIMRTSKNLGLQSEASMRFERFVDPNGAVDAANRAAQFVAELGDGRILKGAVDAYPKPLLPVKLDLRTKRVNKILGTKLSSDKVSDILERLELEVKKKKVGSKGTSADSILEVKVPTFRPDLNREIDLIEEIVRLYGYNKVKSTLPESKEKKGELTFRQQLEKKTRDCMIATGLWEVITYAFINPDDFNKMRLSDDCPLRRVTELRNPLSIEQSVMRTTLIPGLLNVVRYNVNREQNNVQIFEMGRTFKCTGKKLPDESLILGAVLTGCWHPDKWYKKEQAVDFFDLKGILSALFECLKIEDWYIVRALHPSFHPGRCAEICVGNEVLGLFGEIHPETQRAFELDQRVQMLEINLDKLYSNAKLFKGFKEVPKFPGVSIDIALVVDEEISVGKLENIIRDQGTQLLRRIEIFDVYRGEQLHEGKKSMAFSLYFQAADRTLDMNEIKKIHERIVGKLTKIGAELRA